MAPRANYTWRFKNGVVRIIDANLGAPSVTNDIEAILDDIRVQGRIAGAKVVYQDSTGIWDQIIVDANGRFRDIKVLGARSEREAVLRVTVHE